LAIQARAAAARVKESLLPLSPPNPEEDRSYEKSHTTGSNACVDAGVFFADVSARGTRYLVTRFRYY
jgi:hypothetical protein